MSSTSVALRSLRDSVWLDQARYEQAEGRYQQALACRHTGSDTIAEGRAVGTGCGLSDSIEATMSIIQQSLSATTQTNRRTDQEQRITALERENQQLKKDLAVLSERVVAIEARIGTSIPIVTNGAAEDKDEEEFDLFGSDDEEGAAVPQAKKAVTHIQQKKPAKPAVVAKSTIVLEVKPWDTETDMKEVEKLVRGIAKDGLLWGASKLVPVAYGIMKLQISCVIEDEKVGTDFLEDSITAFEDHVQSVDVVAFNKI